MTFVDLLMVALVLQYLDWLFMEKSKDWWCEYMVEEMNRKSGITCRTRRNHEQAD